MIEIVLMIFVVVWFTTTAKNKNKNKILWGTVGALSYYVPVLIFGFIIFPLITVGWVTKDNETVFKVINFFFSLTAGVIGVLIAKRTLEKSDLTAKSKKMFLISIIGGLLILLVALFLLNYFKVKSGTSIYGLENVTGLQKLDKGDYVGAIDEFNKAIKRQPNKSALYYNRGLAYEKVKDYNKAIENFHQSIEINTFKEKAIPTAVYYKLANSYAAINEVDSSLKYYQKTNELDPTDNLVILNIAFIFNIKGDTNQVCKYLKDIKNLDPKFQDAFNNLNAKCKE
jgi:tetratricopeptide (TPR) repeat protein